MATASFGVLYTHFGGDFKGSATINNDALLIPVYSRKQTGFSLPAPELSVGLGFRI